MISQSIAKYLNGLNIDLKLGTTLFAETGRGDRHVVVAATAINGDPDLSFVRQAVINILVAGYPAATGLALADNICNALAALQARQIDKYFIVGVTVRNWPTMIPRGDGMITMNLEVSFKAT